MLVLLIFKQHARTKEAKLQTSLAELMYFRQRMRFYGSENALVPLGQREGYIKRELDNIQMHRRQLRRKREGLQLPVIMISAISDIIQIHKYLPYYMIYVN